MEEALAHLALRFVFRYFQILGNRTNLTVSVAHVSVFDVEMQPNCWHCWPTIANSTRTNTVIGIGVFKFRCSVSWHVTGTEHQWRLWQPCSTCLGLYILMHFYPASRLSLFSFLLSSSPPSGYETKPRMKREREWQHLATWTTNDSKTQTERSTVEDLTHWVIVRIIAFDLLRFHPNICLKLFCHKTHTHPPI